MPSQHNLGMVLAHNWARQNGPPLPMIPVFISGKPAEALANIRARPQDWFSDAAIDDRDRDLLNASVPASFVKYGRSPFLRRIIEWDVETDEECKKMVAQGVNLNIAIPSDAEMSPDWGYISGKLNQTPMFRGPASTGLFDRLDAVILRDFTASTDSFVRNREITWRKWDILVMRIWGDWDHPWGIISINDVGENVVHDPACDGGTVGSRGCHSL
ncbi:hypothetical protein F5Y15DRAFT_410394 [Xylariaceae sp. FL0016]|nr:hypothetical protein F5Y15DRAFT_410394 [Xylariaceae sp. FL0016]